MSPLEPGHLNFHSFFDRYIINPFSSKLSKNEQISAVCLSVLTGIFTLGIAHLVIFLKWYFTKKISPLHNQKTIFPTVSQKTQATARLHIFSNSLVDSASPRTMKMSHQTTGQLQRENFSTIMQQQFIDPCYAKPLPKQDDVTVLHPTTNEKVKWSSLTIQEKVLLNNKYAHAHDRISDPEYPDIDKHFFADGQHVYLPGDPRKHHGSDHAVRTSIFAAVFAHLYNKYYPNLQLNKSDILLIQCVAAGHDSGRQTEGVDVHDEDSAEITVSTLQRLGIKDPNILSECKKAITEKDSSSWDKKSFLARCIQNADSAEYARLILKGPVQDETGFQNSRNYLDIYKEMTKLAQHAMKEQNSENIDSVILKNGLTYKDFMHDLDAIRLEMNAFIYKTHTEKSRAKNSLAETNYYDQLLSRMTSIRCPIMNEMLISAGVLNITPQGQAPIIGNQAQRLIQQAGGIHKLTFSQINTLIASLENVQDSTSIRELYIQLQHEKTKRAKASEKFENNLREINTDKTPAKIRLHGHDLVGAYLELSIEDRKKHQKIIFQLLGLDNKGYGFNPQKHIEFLNSPHREYLSMEFFHSGLTTLVDHAKKELHTLEQPQKIQLAHNLQQQANNLLQQYNTLPTLYRDDTIQTTAALAFAKAHAIFLQHGLQKEALMALRDASSNIRLETSHPLYDLENIMKDKAPHTYILSDSDCLRKRKMRLNKINVDGQPYYEVSIELRHKARKDLEEHLKLLQSDTETYDIQTVPYEYYGKDFKTGQYTTAKKIAVGQEHKITLKNVQNSPEVFIGKEQNYYNLYHTIRVRLKPGSTGQDLHTLFSQIGLPVAIMPSRSEDILSEMRARSLAFRYPELINADPLNKIDPDILYDQLPKEKKICVDKDCQNSFLSQVGVNQSEMVQPSIAQEAWKQGVASLGSYINAGNIKQTAQVLTNILNTGCLSSQERYRQGILGLGCAPTYNLEVGSGNQVFTRMLPKSLFSNNYPLKNFPISGPILLLYDVRALERMPYSYKKDRGGIRNPHFHLNFFSPEGQIPELNYRGSDKLKERQGFCAFIDDIKKQPHPTAETMFDETLSPKYIQKIVVSSEDDRNIVIDRLERAKIYEVNGMSIKDIVVCSSTLNPSLIKDFDKEELPPPNISNNIDYF